MHKKPRSKPATKEQKQLYCFVGEALCAVQLLEDCLSHVIVMKGEAQYPPAIPKAEMNKLREQYRTYTFGQAIKHTKKIQLFPEELQEQLEAFLPYRNWLVHKSISHNADYLETSSSFHKLIMQKVHTVKEQAQILQEAVEEDLFAYAEGQGMDLTHIRAQIERYYNEG